jgi:1-acyl-sn-glycerol-3-phosphate acyltransferase
MPWRRLLTIPGYAAAWLLWLATAPIWLALAGGIDLLRRQQAVALRSVAFITVYLSCEVAGVVASGALWLWRCAFGIEAERWTDLHFRLEAWWGATLFWAIVRLFDLRVEVEGRGALERGPFLMLPRHSSSADTLIASAIVSRPHGMRLRYVLKREMRWDPCLDIVGHRVPNVFIDRDSKDPAQEVRRLRALARRLGPRDGVLIYPEGTRFTPAKRDRVIERFEEAGDARMLEFARSLHGVLPPRLGGTLALLEAAPEADVVFCAHTGFEGTASIGDIWSGALLHRVIRIEFRRIPRSAIPRDREARLAWLLEEWCRLDAWVTGHPSIESAPAEWKRRATG